ncbi:MULTISPECIES: McrC family protein [Streptomyces]|uniref:McrC family protein n=2 Tax=Streptomyces TaxID=1883 RepID=A0AB39NWF6_9ACTN|nr:MULTISPECIES: restriction endonuclease [Streptomyces]MCI4140766.1 McrC family protein [Streptomyces sp. MMS20-AI2-20]GGP96704.1 McrBC 5-methylcytosine restriction system component [Streptomyces gancidicus]GGS29041.1 McrBC 5-methylcytosine restriction system component [Streptomyces rubiginosus]
MTEPVPDVVLREYGPAVSVPLGAAAGRALAASGILRSVTPDPARDGHWLLRAGSRVGALRTPGGPIVRIMPKTPVSRIFFLLGFSLAPERAWHDDREGTVDTGAYDDVVPALAHAVERRIDAALRQGVLQGYREVEESSLVVRGRILEAEQIRRHFGRTPPVEIAYDDYTADTAENRILRAAVERLLRLPGVPGPVRRRLAHQRVRLADALPLVRGQELPRWQPSRLNSRYQPTLRLCEAVLRGSSPEHTPPGADPLAVDGFLIDMNQLFEDFVTVALSEALKEHGLTARLQDTHHLDTAGLVRIRPDLVVRTRDGRTPVAVVDAKYKVEKGDGRLNADLYQALAYATVLGLREAHLVYAAGRLPTRFHEVRGTAAGADGRGVLLHQHSVDLSREPGQLLSALRDIAVRLARARTPA